MLIKYKFIFFRYYYADVKETHKKIKDMSEDDWDRWYTVELRELKKNLLNILEIQPVDNEVNLQQLFKEVKDMREQLLAEIRKPGS